MFKLFWVHCKGSENRGICNVFYIYANNLYNPLFVFSVFGFRKQIDIDLQIRIKKNSNVFFATYLLILHNVL